MNNKDEVLECLIDQLRQRVNSNQCGDLALVAELHETIKLMNEDFNRIEKRGGPLPKGVRYVVGEHGPEKSDCTRRGAAE
ncbi:hypothetical protein SGPC_00042 [Salmonella phage SGPC]|uniref:hypothetical protein n=1 Tax=Salmonella phage SGPC TaxID=2877945 RepID=UPI00240EE620|nr:hypothetical protein QA064_gp42 [Salmonella phage SGPC]UCR75468.1 hypothetical protein SGPC_00042 [Salmonella phage SGPC]